MGDFGRPPQILMQSYRQSELLNISRGMKEVDDSQTCFDEDVTDVGLNLAGIAYKCIMPV